MLSDGAIRKAMKQGKLKVHPEPEDCRFQPASIDLSLGDEVILIQWPQDERRFLLPLGYLEIKSNACVLATTIEEIHLPNDIIARVEGKSSWGRQFIMVHSTAGFIDPGFRGQITLEMKNLGPRPVRIPVGAAICQVSFDWLSYPADRPYGHPDLRSHYQGQTGPTPAVLYPAQ